MGTVLQGGLLHGPPKRPSLCSPPPVSIPCLCPSEEPMVRGRSVSGVRWAGGVRGIQRLRRRPEGQPEPFSLPLPPLPAAMLPDANKEEILIPQIAAFMRLGRRTGRRAQVRSGVRARPRARAPGCLPARSPHHLPCSAFLKCVRRAGVGGGGGGGAEPGICPHVTFRCLPVRRLGARWAGRGAAELQHGAGPSQLAWGRAAESAGAAASVFPGPANPETSWQQTQSPSPQFSHGQSRVAPLPLTDGAPGGT